MLEQFAEDAELVFDGVPVGPFRGRAAIAAAYRERPPDDEIEVRDVSQTGNTVTADYAWRKNSGGRAGQMILTVEDDRITRAVITFTDPVEP
jgi:steroid delta-isomerase